MFRQQHYTRKEIDRRCFLSEMCRSSELRLKITKMDAHWAGNGVFVRQMRNDERESKAGSLFDDFKNEQQLMLLHRRSFHETESIKQTLGNPQPCSQVATCFVKRPSKKRDAWGPFLESPSN